MRTIVSSLMFVLVLAGAGGWVIPTNTAPDSVKEVRLGYFANLTHAQAILGVESGEFEKAIAPAKLTTRTFNAGPSLIEALFAGEIDIGYVGPSPAANAFVQSRGKGLKVIAGAAGDGVVIVARAGSGIEKLADVKGRRIATPQMGNTQDISARHHLTSVLGQRDTSNVVPVPNAEQSAMMARGQIDAAWVAEPWGARLVAEAGAKVIAEERDLWPSVGRPKDAPRFGLTLVVVSPEFLAKHPDVVEQVLRVHCVWTARLRADAGRHVPMLALGIEHATGKRLSDAVLTEAIGRVRFTDDPLPESIRTFAQWAVDLQLAKAVPDVGSLIDRSILDRLRASGGEGPGTTPGGAPGREPGDRP